MFYRYSLLYEEELCTPFIKITHVIYIDFSDSCDPNLNGTCGFAGTCSGIQKGVSVSQVFMAPGAQVHVN